MAAFKGAEKVKLPGHRPGLPGKVIFFHVVPLDPPIPLWRDGARSGHFATECHSCGSRNPGFPV